MAPPQVRLRWSSETSPQERIFSHTDIISIGREDTNLVVLPLPSISRHHANIQWMAGNYCLNDLGSQNGTFVCGIKVDAAPWILKTGDVILIDNEEIQFELLEQGQPSPETAEAGKKPEDNPPASEEPAGPPEQPGFPEPAGPQEQVSHPRPPEFTVVRPRKPGTHPFFTSASQPRLIVQEGMDMGRAFQLADEIILIGRAMPGSPCQIQLNDANLLAAHARLVKMGPAYWLANNLENTTVNGLPTSDDPIELKDGDILCFGKVKLIYRNKMHG